MNDDMRRLEVIAKLEAQCARYAYSWDDRNAQGWLDVFTQDGIFELYPFDGSQPTVRVQGQAELAAFAQQKFSSLGSTHTHHRQCSLYIDVREGEVIHSRTSVLVTHQSPEDASPRIAFSGVYYDIWNKEGAAWKLAQRTFKP